MQWQYLQFSLEIEWKDQPHGIGTFVNEQGEYVVISSVPHGHHNGTSHPIQLRIVNFMRGNSFRQPMVALSGGRVENVKSATCAQSQNFTLDRMRDSQLSQSWGLLSQAIKEIRTHTSLVQIEPVEVQISLQSQGWTFVSGRNSWCQRVGCCNYTEKTW